MAESEEIHSDEELTQATKDGRIREGIARIHFKLFPKYGFLIPENPLYTGETIFFGLTAHVDASRKYIADLRDEIYPDQRVRYMAVPVDRDGTVKWKALVVGPLPSAEQEIVKFTENIENTNQRWFKCTIHPNLMSTHGFATPEGGDQYHDNVYFSLREAVDGDETVNDLKAIFSSGEVINALVVPADVRFKAKYRAIKVCKLTHSENIQQKLGKRLEENVNSLVEESDLNAVSWILDILQSKGSVKLTSLAGDVSRNMDVRNVVLPQKKSVKRFLLKYPKFFSIKDDIVYTMPDCPPICVEKKIVDSDEISKSKVFAISKSWSSEDNSSVSQNGDDKSDEAFAASSSISFTSMLTSVADLTSSVTVNLLAEIVNRYKTPMKISDVYKLCRHHGWEGMKSVAMVAEVITNNPKYFNLDERSSVSLSTEGLKLVSKSTECRSNQSQIEMENGHAAMPINQSPGTYNGSTQNLSRSSDSIFATSTNPLPTTHSYELASAGVSRRAYTPIGTNIPGLSTDMQNFNANASDSFLETMTFPTSSVLTGANGRFSPNDDKFAYQSDHEDSFDEKLKAHKILSAAHLTDEESRFLSVVAYGICPNAIEGKEEVFNLLYKQLESMGVMQCDGEGNGIGGTLSRHLLCIQLDMGKKPRGKFQVFTPSGKINQITVSLETAKVSETALPAMLSDAYVQANIVRVGRLLYGMDKTYHCIRMMTNGLDEVSGCTVTFRSRDTPDVRLSDMLKLGDRTKVRIILSDVNRGTTSSAACTSLRKFAEEKSVNSMVLVVDMEGQIFGFGLPTYEARLMICDSLDMQQRHLKESVHHQPNYVIANAVDCLETLNLLQRIYSRGISIYAEVAKSLEVNVKNIFKFTAE